MGAITTRGCIYEAGNISGTNLGNLCLYQACLCQAIRSANRHRSLVIRSHDVSQKFLPIGQRHTWQGIPIYSFIFFN